MYTFSLHRSAVRAKHRMFSTLMYLRCSLLRLCTNFHVSSYFNSTHILAFHLSKIQVNNTHLSSYFSICLFPTRLKKLYALPNFLKLAACTTHLILPLVYLCNKTRWKITNCDSLKATFPPYPTIFLTILFSSPLHLYFIRERDQVSHPHKTRGKTAV